MHEIVQDRSYIDDGFWYFKETRMQDMKLENKKGSNAQYVSLSSRREVWKKLKFA